MYVGLKRTAVLREVAPARTADTQRGEAAAQMRASTARARLKWRHYYRRIVL